MLKVFLDANVYFAGFSSKEGASSLILEMARRKKIILYASKLVLREADRNLRKKSTPAGLKAFRRYIQDTKIYGYRSGTRSGPLVIASDCRGTARRAPARSNRSACHSRMP